MSETLKGADAVVLAVRHEAYLGLDPDKIIKMTGRPAAIVDCFGILNDNKIRRFFELGCEVKGLGRGHVKRIKDEIHDKSLTKMTDKKFKVLVTGADGFIGAHLTETLVEDGLGCPGFRFLQFFRFMGMA